MTPTFPYITILKRTKLPKATYLIDINVLRSGQSTWSKEISFGSVVAIYDLGKGFVDIHPMPFFGVANIEKLNRERIKKKDAML